MHFQAQNTIQYSVLHKPTVDLQGESKADDIKYKNKKCVICHREGNIMAPPKRAIH
jgi:hypothetical protein